MVRFNGHDGSDGCQHGVLGGNGRTEAEAAGGDVQRRLIIVATVMMTAVGPSRSTGSFN